MQFGNTVSLAWDGVVSAVLLQQVFAMLCWAHEGQEAASYCRSNTHKGLLHSTVSDLSV